MGPKCALWDCQRPAQGSDLCKDYCSSMHAELAFNEGEVGMSSVLRPGGSGLKDDRLFSALLAKMDGKFVGIPECHGAAVEKSPWNASKLFDLSLLEGETIRNGYSLKSLGRHLMLEAESKGCYLITMDALARVEEAGDERTWGP